MTKISGGYLFKPKWSPAGELPEPLKLLGWNYEGTDIQGYRYLLSADGKRCQITDPATGKTVVASSPALAYYLLTGSPPQSDDEGNMPKWYDEYIESPAGKAYAASMLEAGADRD